MTEIAQYAVVVLLMTGAVAWHVTAFRFSPRLGLVRPNFHNKPIMASYGIVAYGYAAAGIASLAVLGFARPGSAVAYLCVMGAMCLLGALDDVFGSRAVSGIRGHFRKLLVEHRLTTGALKAIGGGVVGIVAGGVLSGGAAFEWIMAALLIPLAANTLNLLDLRPGRACAVFLAGLGVTCISVLGRVSEPWIVCSVALIALAFWTVDSRGRAMMGDSGSNMLGAALGVTMVMSTGAVFQVGGIALMAAIHIYSEKRSISGLIESNKALRKIDRRLGVR